MLNLFKSFIFLLLSSVVFFAMVRFFVVTETIAPVTTFAFDWEKEVFIYYGNREMGDPNDCSEVFPVKRFVLNAESLGPGALMALLDGPSDSLDELEYFSGITNKPNLTRFEVLNATAYIDFGEEFKQNLANDCRTDFVYSQIENTLTALPDIDRVVISVDGKN
jgi:spore germination protein GerM